MVVIFMAVFAMYLPQPLTPNYLSNQIGLDLSRIGMLFSISSIGVVVFNLILGALAARTGFLFGQAAVAAFALILWRGSGLPWYLVGFFMLGGYKTARTLGMAQVRELVPSAMMGLAYGFSETVGGTAIILAPLLAGYLYTQNPTLMYAFGFGLIVVSIFMSARFSPTPHVEKESTSFSPNLSPQSGHSSEPES
jgi:hypothetical protein